MKWSPCPGDNVMARSDLKMPPDAASTHTLTILNGVSQFSAFVLIHVVNGGKIIKTGLSFMGLFFGSKRIVFVLDSLHRNSTLAKISMMQRKLKTFCFTRYHIQQVLKHK